MALYFALFRGCVVISYPWRTGCEERAWWLCWFVNFWGERDATLGPPHSALCGDFPCCTLVLGNPRGWARAPCRRLMARAAPPSGLALKAPASGLLGARTRSGGAEL